VLDGRYDSALQLQALSTIAHSAPLKRTAAQCVFFNGPAISCAAILHSLGETISADLRGTMVRTAIAEHSLRRNY
jgi:hypothetical protein